MENSRLGSGWLLIACAFTALQLTACANVEENCAASYTTESTDQELGINDSALGGDELAQSFQLTEAREISSVQIRLQKKGTIASGYSLVLTLETNDSNGNAPSGTSAGGGEARLDVSLISTTGYYTFTFSSAASLSAETTYWLRLRAEYPQSNSAAASPNLVYWSSHDGSSNTYSSGSAVYETSTSNQWQTSIIGSLRDLLFKIGC